MAAARVGRWGKNLAIRVPASITRSAGLRDGEQVEIETADGDIVIRRPAAHADARARAEQAAAEIIADSRRYSLGDATIRELREQGRRG